MGRGKQQVEVDSSNDQEEEEEEEASSDGEESGSEGQETASSSSGSGSGDTEDSDFPDVSEEDADSEEEGEGPAELTVEFEFFSPEEKDFLGLKALLVPYLNGIEFESSALIDAIIKEDDVGLVVKTDSDDDPIAIMSVLSAQKHKGQAFMEQICKFLLDSCPKQAIGKRLAERCQQAFDSPGTGLLMNDRFMNAPPKLSPPLFMFLMESIKKKAASGEEGAAHYRFERFLLATRVYMDKGASTRFGAERGGSSSAEGAGDAGPSSSGRPAKKQKQEGGGASASGAALPAAAEIIFVRPEDHYLHQQCEWYFTFPVESRPVGKDGLQQCRLVMEVTADKMAAVQQQMDEEVGNMALAGGSAVSEQDVARMGQEAMAAAAAAGAGKGAGGGGGSKKKRKGFAAKAAKL